MTTSEIMVFVHNPASLSIDYVPSRRTLPISTTFIRIMAWTLLCVEKEKAERESDTLHIAEMSRATEYSTLLFALRAST